MTWSTPMTAVDGPPLTAAQWNASVRDNLLETAAAKATTAGYHFASTGTNSIAERAIVSASIATGESTPSTTYTNLTTPGPSVTCTTGPQALVFISTAALNSGAGNLSIASVNITGASTISPSQANSIWTSYTTSARVSACCLIPLTSGSNTFQMQYRVIAGTGTFDTRSIAVMAL